MRPSNVTRRAAAPDARCATRPRFCGSGNAPEEPSVVLGPGHPLTHAIDAIERVRTQLLVVVAVLIGSIVDLTEGALWAATLALSAAIVLLGLMIAAAAFRQRKRDRAIDLILEGRDRLPIAAVQHERRRLVGPRTQRQMAHAIEGIVEQALKRPGPFARSARPLFNTAVVATVAEELSAISAVLQTEHASVRGVALAERLLTDGRSPFYGDQPRLLREELQRIQRAMRN
jgi:hypothetical protein